MIGNMVIEYNANDSQLIYKGFDDVEETFQWLQDNVKNVNFKGRLAAELFVKKCNQSIKTTRSARRHNVLNYTCSLGRLCPFRLIIVPISENANERSGLFYVKKLVLHNHSPESRVYDKLSKTEVKMILLERDVNRLTEEINSCNQKIKELKNKSCRVKYEQTRRNKVNEKKRKEEMLKIMKKINNS